MKNYTKFTVLFGVMIGIVGLVGVSEINGVTQDDPSEIGAFTKNTGVSGATFVPGQYFTIEFEGFPQINGIVSVTPGPIKIELDDTAQHGQSSQFTPGAIQYEEWEIKSLATDPSYDSILDWMEQYAQEGSLMTQSEVSFTLYLNSNDGSTILRTINCFGVVPVSFGIDSPEASSTIPLVTTTFIPGHCELG